jgi:hypothetical protein
VGSCAFKRSFSLKGVVEGSCRELLLMATLMGSEVGFYILTSASSFYYIVERKSSTNTRELVAQATMFRQDLNILNYTA